MAIDTNNKKLAVMEWGLIWHPGLPLLPGAFGTDDQQQLIHGYPGIAWGAPPAPGASGRPPMFHGLGHPTQ